MNRRQFLWGTGLAGAALGGVGWRDYRAVMSAAEARINADSTVLETRSGRMEYAEAGSGPPLLMLHGTGGGFDQGLGFARPLSQTGWRVIAPSRFGYLRSDYPADASSEAQADALVDLLDALGIDRVPVAGGSAGALPALQFAIRHPERCSALVALVPATHVPGRPPPQPVGAMQNAIMDYALGSDLLFWAGIRLAPDSMIRTLLATDPALVQAGSPAEQERVRSILHGILPISARARGLRQDGRLAGAPKAMEIERITAPTLAISLEDDLFGTMAAARHIAATVPGARLVSYPTGGHVWVGHDDEVFGEIDVLLRSL